MKKSLKDLQLKGKKVLMRVDFNVPLHEDGSIRDDSRIQLTLPSIKYILHQGGRLILISHLGRPKGKKIAKLSMQPIATHLAKLLRKPVYMASNSIGPEVEKQADQLKDGDILLLENIRFHEGEEYPDKDPKFLSQLAKLGNIYVNDAFGTAHRIHTSTVLLAQKFPENNAVGFLMEKEISFFSKLIRNPNRPFYAVIGGAKVGTKIGVLQALTAKIDAIFIGGGMAFTFLKSQGIQIGESLCEDKHLLTAQKFLTICQEKGIQVYLPEDYIITQDFAKDAKSKTVLAKNGIDPGWLGMDIGKHTIKQWSALLEKGATIFWNGPMGVFEFPPFAKGTYALAKLLGKLHCTVIVGGGDSVAAVKAAKIQENFTHISSGGGASLEYIEFGSLPGIDALNNR